MKIKIEEIKYVMDLITNHLIDSGVSEIEIEEDFYWSIQQQDLYNPYKEPSNLTMGQLSSDWENLQKIASRQNLPTGYGLVWLSSISKNIGERVVS